MGSYQIVVDNVQVEDYYVEVLEVVAGRYNPRAVHHLRHNYASHPLLQLDRLEKLANDLQALGGRNVKFLDPEIQEGSAFATRTEAHNGRTISEAFQSIESPGSWVALYRVADDPEYRALVWDIVHSVRANVEESDPGIYKVDGFIFVSSPPSLTPFHIDRENNFFLQVHGKKRFSVWSPDDRRVVSEHAVENFVAHYNLDEVRFVREAERHCAYNSELVPGEGIYMPSTSPHMSHTENSVSSPDETYSISIGVVFYTETIRRAGYVYALNTLLRRLRLPTVAPYKSKTADRFNSLIGRLLVALRSNFTGYEVPPGFHAHPSRRQ
jgi:hypothetical protein